ncbi:spermidine synthase [Thalassolituus oleivorans]|uniref:spermidine synthase n=1 Tax=Thalassolituus oleivorans TaxID=187493 RepID=UPI002408FFD2|nr:methyltransferase domain-containing protein [Thalassolituus oleivorans]MDF1642324.1 methyltransferase domain-containing protein [Thalassolituus oleivorans]
MDILALPHLGKEVHRRYDDLGIIQVYEDGNKRYLSFGTADEQSCQLKAKPGQPQHGYARAMMASLCLLKPDQAVQQASVLGTGGGLMARCLFEQLPTTQVHTVDLRPAVIQIAHQYFGLPRDKRLTTHAQSAMDYLNACPTNSQGLLLSDLYLANGLDTRQLKPEFVSECRRVVQNDGWLVLNLWKEHREDGLFLPQLKAQFQTVLHSTTSDGNWIIWACPNANAAPDKRGAQLICKRLSEQMGFNLWQVTKGFYRFF